MPGGDGTGPLGTGPIGGGRGAFGAGFVCGAGRRFGRGRGRNSGGFMPEALSAPELTSLKQETQALRAELAAMEKKLANLESNDAKAQ